VNGLFIEADEFSRNSNDDTTDTVFDEMDNEVDEDSDGDDLESLSAEMSALLQRSDSTIAAGTAPVASEGTNNEAV
jgi:ribosome maturation factor RimP